jgi:hypothetical protein
MTAFFRRIAVIFRRIAVIFRRIAVIFRKIAEVFLTSPRMAIHRSMSQQILLSHFASGDNSDFIDVATGTGKIYMPIGSHKIDRYSTARSKICEIVVALLF